MLQLSLAFLFVVELWSSPPVNHSDSSGTRKVIIPLFPPLPRQRMSYRIHACRGDTFFKRKITNINDVPYNFGTFSYEKAKLHFCSKFKQNELFPSLDRPNPRRKPQHKACTNAHPPPSDCDPAFKTVCPEAEVGPAALNPGLPPAVVLSYTHNGWSNVVTSI